MSGRLSGILAAMALASGAGGGGATLEVERRRRIALNLPPGSYIKRASGGNGRFTRALRKGFAAKALEERVCPGEGEHAFRGHACHVAKNRNARKQERRAS